MVVYQLEDEKRLESFLAKTKRRELKKKVSQKQVIKKKRNHIKRKKSPFKADTYYYADHVQGQFKISSPNITLFMDFSTVLFEDTTKKGLHFLIVIDSCYN